jgi:exopolysaccharide biosynthesis polyprenyl glycosylphosphotransferase
MVREVAMQSAAGATTREHRRWPRPEPRVLHDASDLHVEKPGEMRLRLQRRAPVNFRDHFLRAAVRFTVLLVADLASFGVMRGLVRVVRDYALVGDTLAGRLEAMLPPGILNGWQYAAALFMGLLVTGNYGRGDLRRNPRRLFVGAALATALPLWMTIWTQGLELALVQYGLVTVLVWIGLVLERRTINQVMAWVRPPERDRMDVLFVGPGAECLESIQEPAFSRGTDYRPIGFVDTRMPPTNGALGHLRDLPAVLDASGAKAVVISGYLTEPQFRKVVDTALAGGCQVLSVPRSVKIAGVHPTTVWRRGQPLVELTAPSLKGWQLVVKRAMDIAGATLGVVLLSPVFALVAALVKLDSPGPAFFTQERVGGGGRRFRIVKFRTMVDGAEKRRDELLSRSLYNDPRLFKVPDDPRVTGLGRWLRRTSLDELPQLVNVLRGEMALVGPRPPLPSEAALYEGHQYARFDVKPGMTGPWQVAGRNGVTAFEEVIALETAYIQNWSVWTDLQLLVKTIPVVVQMRGAY